MISSGAFPGESTRATNFVWKLEICFARSMPKITMIKKKYPRIIKVQLADDNSMDKKMEFIQATTLDMFMEPLITIKR